MKNPLPPDWQAVLGEEFEKEYFGKIRGFLEDEIKAKRTFYPDPNDIFRAFHLCPWENLKVVILGQDPYHGPGQAHGLSFSVPKDQRIPPSLRNIYKEIHSDLGLPIPDHGNLEHWANQGVLLLNAALTVRANEANSHSQIGWHDFTDTVIQKISVACPPQAREKSGIVFLLWGKFAQNKAELIDSSKHHILKSPHPSPFSADRGFFGCRHFSKTNEILKKQNQTEIDWTVV